MPLDCLKILSGRIQNVHMKDLNEKSPDAHDVPWGQGVSDIPAVLDELKSQAERAFIEAGTSIKRMVEMLSPTELDLPEARNA